MIISYLCVLCLSYDDCNSFSNGRDVIDHNSLIHVQYACAQVIEVSKMSLDSSVSEWL